MVLHTVPDPIPTPPPPSHSNERRPWVSQTRVSGGEALTNHFFKPCFYLRGNQGPERWGGLLVHSPPHQVAGPRPAASGGWPGASLWSLEFQTQRHSTSSWHFSHENTKRQILLGSWGTHGLLYPLLNIEISFICLNRCRGRPGN